MKRSRTGSSAGKAPAAPPVATVQVPLPLLAVLADAKTAFFGLCLTAGQQVFQTLMEQDRAQLCGPKNVPDPDRHAYRGGSAPSEVVLGGRRIVLPRLRARSVTGEELMIELGGGPSTLRFVSQEAVYGESYEDVPRRVPDVTRMQRLLGLRATTPLAEGLARTIAWFRAAEPGAPSRA